MPLRKYNTIRASDRATHTSSGFIIPRIKNPYSPPNPPPPPPPPCPESGTEIGEPIITDFMYDAGCGPVKIGETRIQTVADGQCGFMEETTNECSVGDFANCNGLIYSSDAQCNVTSRPACPDEGTVISQRTTGDIMYDAGCGPVQIGYTYETIVADGQCGERVETFNECNVGDFTTCNGMVYSSDLQCNVTSRPECSADGTVISQRTTGDVMYDAGCGPVQIGYTYETIVADGQCGERVETHSECSVGDFTTCNGYIYSSDSECNVTSRPEEPPPPECPEGYYWDGTSCVPNNPPPPDCGAGYYWNGTECVPENTNCGEGYYWDGTQCVPNNPPPPDCGEGYYWDGTSCQPNP
jgi:hypothetical protein